MKQNGQEVPEPRIRLLYRRETSESPIAELSEDGNGKQVISVYCRSCLKDRRAGEESGARHLRI